MHASLTALVLALSLLGTLHAQQVPVGENPATDGKVWGALVYASSGEGAAPDPNTPPELADLSARLGKVFNYSRFEVIGQHTQDVFRQYESWVVPSKDLFLKVDSKGPVQGEPDAMNLGVQFWQAENVLVKTDVVLRRGSPLFVGGPKWREGQLLFVLLLKKAD
jgi:hypothetical protein